MKKLFVLLVLFLSACTALAPEPQPLTKELMVYEGEYVIEASGDWCPWAPGQDECVTVYGRGTYVISETEHVKLIRPEVRALGGSPVVPYDSEKDLCKSEFAGEECSPNWVMSIEAPLPNDPYYPDMWALKNIQMEKAWEAGNSSMALVAVIDTGVKCDHPDLVGSCIAEYNAITREVGDGKAADGSGHGTHVAGTICASGNNGVGITGTLWGCQLLAIKFLSDSGSGSLYNGVAAIDFAVQRGAKVINASWGGGGYSAALYNAIKRAGDAGVLFVAASGNDGINTDAFPHYPSAYDLPNIVSVAAIDAADNRAVYSNYGRKTVDLAAPGSAILSTYKDGGYKTLSGTSMATPHVSGVAALIIERFPGLTTQEVEHKLFSTVKANEALRDTVTRGSLDAFKAISEPTPVPTPSPCLKRLEKCLDGCRERFECEFAKQRRCRGECRKSFNCKGNI